MIKQIVLSYVLICCVCVVTPYVIYLSKNLTEDSQQRWPKHIGRQADYNKINLHNFIGTCWSISHNQEFCLYLEVDSGALIIK